MMSKEGFKSDYGREVEKTDGGYIVHSSDKFYYDFFTDLEILSDGKYVPHTGKYRRYGDLPDGNHFGIWVFPSMHSFADFRDPPFTGIVIVDEDGRLQSYTPAEHMHLEPDERFFPTMVAASPTGKTLVWITEGELWTWHACSDGHFIGDDGEQYERLGEHRISDALMHEDGILEITLESGDTFGFFCDEDALLVPFRDGWIPAEENDVWQILQCDSCWPDSLMLMIKKEYEGWKSDSLSTTYNECGVRRVCFEPGLETIKHGILAMNDNLETVVIPDHVIMVESFAFGCCSNLKNLTIEGDLSRIANWAEDAFDGCPCEEYYKTERKKQNG